MLDYQIDLMPTSAVPVGGAVVITFPVEYPSLPKTTCYNLDEGSVLRIDIRSFSS